MFKKFDANNDGHINFEEFTELMRSDPTIMNLLNSDDVNINTKIKNYLQFLPVKKISNTTTTTNTGRVRNVSKSSFLTSGTFGHEKVFSLESTNERDEDVENNGTIDNFTENEDSELDNKGSVESKRGSQENQRWKFAVRRSSIATKVEIRASRESLGDIGRWKSNR